MNKRIDKLAEQAGASVLREQTRSGDWVDFSDYTGFDYTKFAELIVKECASHLNWVGDDAAGIELLEHFGVEE